MEKKSKLINIRISPGEYEQIKQLADEKGMTVSQYVRYMATIFFSNNIQFENLTGAVSKKQLEKDLMKMTKSLERQKKYIEMLLSSVNSTALRLESQFKRIRLDAAKELGKDLKRINYLFESTDENES